MRAPEELGAAAVLWRTLRSELCLRLRCWLGMEMGPWPLADGAAARCHGLPGLPHVTAGLELALKRVVQSWRGVVGGCRQRVTWLQLGSRAGSGLAAGCGMA